MTLGIAAASTDGNEGAGTEDSGSANKAEGLKRHEFDGSKGQGWC